MSKSKTTTTVPAPLKALGGWLDAAWFCPSVLSDAEVVGFKFPSVPGVRKQNFQITDRSTSDQSARKTPANPAKSTTGKLANILDDIGATTAVACSRSRFLFETQAVLFFAAIPLAKLKPKSANKLRRDLIDIGARGCVVQVQGNTVIAMFWPAAEDAITGFVEAAAPDYPIHIDFFQSPERKGADARAQDREKKLLQEVIALRAQVETLQRSQSIVGAMETLGLDDARLKSMLTLLHPDKHGGSAAANDAAKWLNNLRDLLKGKPA